MMPALRVEEAIRSRAAEWQTLLGLDHFDIEHVFSPAFYSEEDVDSVKTVATTVARWQYLEAVITWYLPSAMRFDEDYLERTLVHELCHVLLSPEQADIPTKHHEKLELTTEMVARALINMKEVQ